MINSAINQTIINFFLWHSLSLMIENNGDVIISNKIVSNIHAISSFIFSFLTLTEIKDINDYNDIVPFTISYVLFDMYYLFKHKFGMRNILFIHHSILFIANFLIYNIDYLESYDKIFFIKHILFNYLAEISNPYIGISSYIYNINQIEKYKSIYDKCNVMTIITFFFFRILNFTYLVYRLTFLKYPFLFLMQLTIMGMNYIWFYKITCIYFKQSVKED